MKIILTENQLKTILNENNKSFNDKIFYHGRTTNRPYNSNYIYITDSMGYANGYSDDKILYLFKIPFSEDKIFSMRNKKHREILKNNIDDNSYNAILNSMSHNEMDWTSLQYIMNDEFEEVEDLLENLGFLGIKLQERPEVESIYIFNQNNLKFIKTINTNEPKYQKIIGKFYKDFQEKYINEQQLNEGTNRGEVYHYTYNIKDILQSNTINLSSSLGTSADKYSDKFFFLSLSRTPGVNIGYGRFHNSRLVLDGNKLNQNFKSIPVDYWGDKRGDVDRSEYEDRIISDKPTIDNISKYIIRIEIVDSEPKRKRNYQLLQLAKERNIPIFFYLNKNDLQRQRNPVNNQVEETVIDDTDTDYVPRSYKYNTDLETILSIVLYKENILDNEELLKSNVEKMIETYKLPKLSLYDIQEKMRNMYYSEWRREDYLTGLKAHLHNYFKSGQGDEFRSWIKILTSEMKKYNLTSISDLANLKFDGLKPKGKFIDYSKTYSIFYYRDGQWEKEDNNNSLKSLSFLFLPTRYGGVITDDDNKNYLDFKDDNKTIGDWLNYLLNKYTLEKVQNIIKVSGYNKRTETYEYKLDKIK